MPTKPGDGLDPVVCAIADSIFDAAGPPDCGVTGRLRVDLDIDGRRMACDWPVAMNVSASRLGVGIRDRFAKLGFRDVRISSPRPE